MSYRKNIWDLDLDSADILKSLRPPGIWERERAGERLTYWQINYVERVQKKWMGLNIVPATWIIPKSFPILLPPLGVHQLRHGHRWHGDHTTPRRRRFPQSRVHRGTGDVEGCLAASLLDIPNALSLYPLLTGVSMSGPCARWHKTTPPPPKKEKRAWMDASFERAKC